MFIWHRPLFSVVLWCHFSNFDVRLVIFSCFHGITKVLAFAFYWNRCTASSLVYTIWSEIIGIIRMALTKFWFIRCFSLLLFFLNGCTRLFLVVTILIIELFYDVWPTMWKGIIWNHHLPKCPISGEMVNEILDKYSRPGSNSKDLRIAAWSGCAAGFAGFFRCNKISTIRPTHLQFLNDYLSIFNPLSNTDVYREGNPVG